MNTAKALARMARPARADDARAPGGARRRARLSGKKRAAGSGKPASVTPAKRTKRRVVFDDVTPVPSDAEDDGEPDPTAKPEVVDLTLEDGATPAFDGHARGISHSRPVPRPTDKEEEPVEGEQEPGMDAEDEHEYDHFAGTQAMDDDYDSDPATEHDRIVRSLQDRIIEQGDQLEEMRIKAERYEAAAAVAAAAHSAAARAIHANRQPAATFMTAPEYDASDPRFADDAGIEAFLGDHYEGGAARADPSAEYPPSEKTIKFMKLLKIPDSVINTVKTQSEASRWIKAAKKKNADMGNPLGLRDI